MKQTTMCVLSGFFGALFAVACGVVDGNANADLPLLQIKSISLDCDGENGIADHELDKFMDFNQRGMDGEVVVSMYFSGCSDTGFITYHYIE